MRAVTALSILFLASSLSGCGSAADAEDALNDARSRATSIQISSIHNAIKMFEIRLGSKPESLQALRDGPSNPAQKARWKGKLLEELPADSWKNQITYRITEDGYELRSSGADGQFNTEDDIVSTGGNSARPESKVKPQRQMNP